MSTTSQPPQTPETDLETLSLFQATGIKGAVSVDFARSLETKLNEAVAEIKLQTERAEHAIDQYLKDQLPEGCETWEKVWCNQVNLTKENQSLLAQIAEKNKYYDISATNSPAAAQELLERYERMEKAIKYTLMKANEGYVSFLGVPHTRKQLEQALQPTTKQPSE